MRQLLCANRRGAAVNAIHRCLGLDHRWADAVVHTIYHCTMFDAPPGWRIDLYWPLTYAPTVSTDTILQRSHQCLSRRQSAPNNLQFFRSRRHLPFATYPRVQPQEQLDAAAEVSASAGAPALQAQLSDSQAAVQELQVRTCM